MNPSVKIVEVGAIPLPFGTFTFPRGVLVDVDEIDLSTPETLTMLAGHFDFPVLEACLYDRDNELDINGRWGFFVTLDVPDYLDMFIEEHIIFPVTDAQVVHRLAILTGRI